MSTDSAAPKPAEWPGVREWLRRATPGNRPVDAGRAWQVFLRKPSGVIGLGLLLLLAAIGVAAPWLFPGDPQSTVAEPMLWPGQNPAFPLGTDSLGRNLAAAVAYGARTSLTVGATAAFVGVTTGIVLGSLAGYFGGVVDGLITRVTELFQTTPTFLLVVVLVALLQPNATVISLAIGFTTWESISRLIRAEFRQLLQSDFVTAARSSGFGTFRLIVHEILPNVLPSVVVMISFNVAIAIFMESSLAFLGLGDPNTVSWGGMINEGRDFLRTAWFLTVIPATAIVITVLALNLVGNTLNDVLNPRLRRVS